jgi:hypothetical protein
VFGAGICSGNPGDFPPAPRYGGIEKIVLLPVVDCRSTNKDTKINFKNMRANAGRVLKKLNHYSVAQSDDATGLDAITEQDLGSGSREWIKRLGPPEARWVMVIGLSDLQGSHRFSTAATVFGFLYDKPEATLSWRGRGVGRPTAPAPVAYYPQAGVLGNAAAQSSAQLADALTKLMFPGLTRGDILSNALANLLAGPSGLLRLPKKKH